MPQPFVIDLNEQASGGYWATLLDEAGVLVPGNVLSALALSLYLVNADGTITICGGRFKQNVLNLNGVTVYNSLQTRADGKTFNLFWQIAQGDTTLVAAPALPVERHVALFEWAWPVNHFGKQEVILSITNLLEVP